MREFKIRYYLDNNAWTDEQFEDAQDIENVFTITEDMIVDLIRGRVELEPGDFISEIEGL
jgi:hypothetical protein